MKANNRQETKNSGDAVLLKYPRGCESRWSNKESGSPLPISNKKSGSPLLISNKESGSPRPVGSEPGR